MMSFLNEPNPYEVLGITPDATKSAVRDAFSRSKRDRVARAANDKLVAPESRLEIDAFMVAPPADAELPKWQEPDWLSFVDRRSLISEAATNLTSAIAAEFLSDIPTGTPLPVWTSQPLAPDLPLELVSRHNVQRTQVSFSRTTSLRASTWGRRSARPPAWLAVIGGLALLVALLFAISRNTPSQPRTVSSSLSRTRVSLTPRATVTMRPTTAFNSIEPPVASFTASQIEGPAPLHVILTNTSRGDADEYTWDAGVGRTFRSYELGEHLMIFSSPGVYSVRMRAVGPGGTDETRLTITVTEPTPSLAPSDTATIAPTSTPIMITSSSTPTTVTPSHTPRPSATPTRVVSQTPRPSSTFTPTATQSARTYIVISNQVINIRSCSSTTCEIVDTASPGERLQIVDVVEGEAINGNSKWLVVTVNEGSGYLHGSLARREEQ